MTKAIVFDLGGTLMEYAGMPLNWSDYYICGFKNLNEILKLNLSEHDLQESADKLKSYNPRISKREYEIRPEIIFNDIISNWREKPDTNKVIEIFFEGLSLKAIILFVGDEEKDFLTALNAGCDFVYINDFLKSEKTLYL